MGTLAPRKRNGLFLDSTMIEYEQATQYVTSALVARGGQQREKTRDARNT